MGRCAYVPSSRGPTASQRETQVLRQPPSGVAACADTPRQCGLSCLRGRRRDSPRKTRSAHDKGAPLWCSTVLGKGRWGALFVQNTLATSNGAQLPLRGIQGFDAEVEAEGLVRAGSSAGAGENRSSNCER